MIKNVAATVGLLIFALAAPASASPTIIDISTTDATKWDIDWGGGYVPASDAGGGFIGFGGTNGVWKARIAFSLPAVVTSVQLTISDIQVDDRVVLQLNGVTIPGANNIIHDVVGLGVHDFGDGAGAIAFDFDGGTNWAQLPPVPVVLSSGFILGGVNELVAYVNNTGTTAPGALPSDGGGPTGLRIDATLAIDVPNGEVPVPAPASLPLLAAGLAALGWARRRG